MTALRFADIASIPIQVDDFAGPDSRFGMEFEALEAQINKGSSLQGSASIDWSKVVEEGSHFLRVISKDLRVAVWLAWACYQTRSSAGLVEGLELLNQLSSTAWPDLHPRKSRTRLAALAWFVSRLESLDGARIREHWPQIEPQLVRLDELLRDHLGEQTPLLRPVIRSLRQNSVDSAPVESTTPVPAAQATVERIPSAAEPQTVDNARDAHRLLRQLQEQSRILCNWWGQQSPGDARALSLARTMLWLPIDELPAHDASGITALRPLPADRVRSLTELVSNGQYDKALLEVEVSLARSPFWLDGQLLAWQCLDGLGKADSKLAVTAAMRSLMQRLPLLPTLRFFDGSAFASESTREWIEQNCSIDAAAAPAPASAPSHDDGSNAWSAALDEAKELVSRDGLAAALRSLRPGPEVSLGSRQAFLWRLARARLCIAAGQRELAINVLEALEHELRSSSLACWEPELLLEVSQLLYWCYDKAPQSAQLTERRHDLFRKLCHLDLEVVLDQAQGPKPNGEHSWPKTAR